jgi:TRAP-type C4-dicarboxylate transport system permease small subunit
VSPPVAQVGHAARRAAEWLAIACTAGLLLLAVATTLDVVLRYAFAKPIRGFVDVASLAGAVLLAGCMPHVLASRSNIAVDALGRWLGGRARRALDAFGALVTAGFFAVMAWQYLRFAAEMQETAQTIPVLRWPVWPWWAAVAACVVVAAAVGFATALHAPDAPDARGDRA